MKKMTKMREIAWKRKKTCSQMINDSLQAFIHPTHEEQEKGFQVIMIMMTAWNAIL